MLPMQTVARSNRVTRLLSDDEKHACLKVALLSAPIALIGSVIFVNEKP
jgi:hypothetical protein